MRDTTSVLSLVTALLLAAPGYAHHSGAMFDQTKTITLAGTVTLFQWSSPHAWIELSVANPGGAATSKWSVEMGSPSVLYRKGWRPHTLKPGDKLTVTIHPVRGGLLGGSYLSGTRGDGKILGDG